MGRIRDAVLSRTSYEEARLVKVNETAALNFAGRFSQRISVAKDTVANIAGEIHEIRVVQTRGADVLSILATGTREGERLGFGPDGSIETQSWLFPMPALLVDDPLGDIVYPSFRSVSGRTVPERRLREAPDEAVRQVLALIMCLHGRTDGLIRPGSVGNTVSTFNPATGNGTGATVDGWASSQFTGSSFATIRNHAGASFSATSTDDDIIQLRTPNATLWSGMTRFFAHFDTASIPDGDTINSATFGIRGTSVGTAAGFELQGNVCESQVVSNNTLANGSFPLVGTTAFSDTAIPTSTYNTSGFNNWTLNAAGRAAVNKTGVTKLAIRDFAYDAPNSAPTHPGAAQTDVWTANHADVTGTSNDPLLTVDHSAAAVAAAPPAIIQQQAVQRAANW